MGRSRLKPVSSAASRLRPDRDQCRDTIRRADAIPNDPQTTAIDRPCHSVQGGGHRRSARVTRGEFPLVNFCSNCGQPVVHRVPPGDNLPRYVCDGCNTIHYQNPNMVVGCVPVIDGRILLCKRSIHPRKGYWTIPAGFMENNETVESGALRETLEEACARVELGSLLAIVNVPHANQVHIMFRSTLLDEDFAAGEETEAVKLFGPDEIPWDEIAFPSVSYALERYLEDVASGREEVHLTRVDRLRL